MISKYEWALFGIIFILIALLGYGGYRYNQLSNNLTQSQFEVIDLQKKLTKSEAEKTNLSAELQIENGKNTIFAEKIDQLSGAVGTLTKLSQTDKELLQKYSKVYFLNENYIPSNLTGINPRDSKDQTQILKIHSGVSPYLQRLFADAKKNKTPLLAVSAYRSFKEQSDLKSNYTVVYGGGANAFSADQGYSEHQLGTTVDFATATSSTATFDKTEAHQWLVDNAYKYGFVSSYPKDNKYYVYEPWHWRFVGVALATKLHNKGKYFYDLDQREIDSYLVSIFD